MRLKSFIIGAIAAVACSAHGQNLLSNGSFETAGPGFVTFANWMNFGNIFAADSGEVIAQDGALSAKMFGASSGAQSDQVLTQNVPATAGEQYTLTTYCQNLSADALGAENIILSQLVFRDAGNNALEVVETNAINPMTDPLDTWVMKQLSAVAPAGTVSVDVFLLHIQLGADQGFPTQGGGASFWDNVSLVGGDAPCTNPADLNGDGEVNFFDVSAFLTFYGQGC
ncbi:MAG: hypothetical protein KDA29_05940 [Phycisphaerales bacterium]|nr:hypothetical protein [Phycisphaerales bacterium]